MSHSSENVTWRNHYKTVATRTCDADDGARTDKTFDFAAAEVASAERIQRFFDRRLRCSTDIAINVLYRLVIDYQYLLESAV